MSNELDLVSDFMNSHELAPADLATARDILDKTIQEEVGERSAVVEPQTSARRRPRWSTARTRVAVAGVAAVAASAVLILQVVPTADSHPPVAAAAQISRLAASVQPAVPLAPGQWSSVQMTGQVLAKVGTVGEIPTPDAQASVPLSIGVWSNSTGTTCTSQQFGTATFAGPANAQAWQAIGLIATPTNQPVTGCVAGVQAALGGGMALTPIDVAELTHDPATLAKELQNGTTGVTSIDESARGGSDRQTAFARLVTLIVGPTSGAWSDYGQEMLETMALLPGVISLGKMTAHSGSTGEAFSTENVVAMNPVTGAVESSIPSPIVVLDPTTGALLEARNFSIPVLQSAGQDFVGSPDAPVFTEGVSYGISTTWIDPVGKPTVITGASLPTWIAGFHSIEAVTIPNPDPMAISRVLDQFVGNGNSSFDAPGLPGPDQTTFELTVTDPSTNIEAVVAALNASGLFQSVTVKA